MSATQPMSDDRRARTRQALNDRLSRPTPTVWLSGAEAAEYIGVSWPTPRQLIREHDIPHVRLGPLYKIDLAILDEHLHPLAHA